MTLELGGRKVVVTGEERELVRTSAESVSHDEADVVIGYVSGRATSAN